MYICIYKVIKNSSMMIFFWGRPNMYICIMISRFFFLTEIIQCRCRQNTKKKTLKVPSRTLTTLSNNKKSASGSGKQPPFDKLGLKIRWGLSCITICCFGWAASCVAVTSSSMPLTIASSKVKVPQGCLPAVEHGKSRIQSASSFWKMKYESAHIFA